MPTEEINILNISVEPEEPQSFDINMDVDIPDGYTLNMRTVLPMGGGAINSISVNGVELPIIEGNVDITVPTSTSELVNNSGFITSAAIEGKADITELAQVAFTGDYDDLNNKPEIPSLDGYATETYVGNAVSAHNESATAHQDIRNEISGIAELIPSQATSSNQLADKNFVNSSIATETATFRGTYNEVNDLSLTTAATHSDIATALVNVISVADSNDYAFVQIPTSDLTPTEIESIERYKFVTGSGWQYEYTLNNSGFTAAQWAAINSGITTGLVTQIGTNASDILTIQGAIATLTTSISGKVDKTGDTMTGGLLFDIASGGRWIGAKRASDSSLNKDAVFFSNSYNGIFFGKLTSDYTGIDTTYAHIRDTNGLVLYGTRGLYYNGSTSSDNKCLSRSEGDARWIQIAPPIATSPTLTSGSVNELGTIDYATIALPATPGTAEYNGTFTSSTAGDIRNNSGLSSVTKWQGDVTIEANATYSFCFQNGSGIIVKML